MPYEDALDLEREVRDFIADQQRVTDDLKSQNSGFVHKSDFDQLVQRASKLETMLNRKVGGTWSGDFSEHKSLGTLFTDSEQFKSMDKAARESQRMWVKGRSIWETKDITGGSLVASMR